MNCCLRKFLPFCSLLAAPLSAQTTFTNTGTAEANNIFVAGNWDNGLPTAANPGTIAGDATWWPADTAGDGSGSTGASSNIASGIDITVTSGTLSRVGSFIPEFTDCIIDLQGGSMSNDGPGSRVFRLSGTSVLTVGAGSTFTHDPSRGMEFQNDGAGTPSIIIDGGTLNGGLGSGDTTGVVTSDTAYAFLTFTANGGYASFDGLDFSVSSPYIDFVSGSTGVLELGTGDATLYEDLWNSGNLRIDGANSGTFSTNFIVSGTQLSLKPPLDPLMLVDESVTIVVASRPFGPTNHAVTIENVGNTQDLSFTSITATGTDAGLVSSLVTPADIAAAGSADITFTFSPPAPGVYQFNLEIDSNDQGTPNPRIVPVEITASVTPETHAWTNGSTDFLWNSTSTNWSSSDTLFVERDSVSFADTTPGVIGTVTLSEDATATEVFLDAAYTIDTDSFALTLDPASAGDVALTVNEDAAIDGSLLLEKSQQWMVASGKTLDLGASFGGAAGQVVLRGGGTLAMGNPGSTIADLAIFDVTVSTPGIGSIADASGYLGTDPAIRFLEATSVLVYTGPGETTDRVIEVGGNDTATLDSSGTGPVVFAGTILRPGTGLANGDLLLRGTTDAEVSGPIIIDGVKDLAVTKEGPNTWTLSGANTYTLATTVNEGTLRLNGATLADESTVSVASGAFLELNFAGTDTIGELIIDGVTQPNGIYDASDFPELTGTGSLQVGSGGSGGFLVWIETFTSLTDPNDKLPGADPDGDGKTNFFEFATDDDPTTGAASGKIVGKLAAVGGDQVLTLTLPVRADADFGFSLSQIAWLEADVDGVLYLIQSSSALDFTEPEPPFVSLVAPGSGDETAIQSGLPALSGGWVYRTFFLENPVGSVPRGFLRASITESP